MIGKLTATAVWMMRQGSNMICMFTAKVARMVMT